MRAPLYISIDGRDYLRVGNLVERTVKADQTVSVTIKCDNPAAAIPLKDSMVKFKADAEEFTLDYAGYDQLSDGTIQLVAHV